MDPAGILLQTDIFGDLTAADVAPLVPQLGECSLDRGQPLWIEGDPALALYVLAAGQLKSHRLSVEGAEVILGINRAIDVVGEVGLFHPTGVRRVSVTAMTPSRCLRIPKAPLLGYLAAHPRAMERMLGRLSLIAGQAAYSFSSLAFDDIRQRVAAALLGLGAEFGEETPDRGLRIRLRLSQSALAALVAASRENVNRALATFVAIGAVSQQDGRFHLHDRAALRRVADSSTQV
ncbi:MAG: Crp/Fnr family transcriptional regulator [Pseudonocardia sp.]|nr:Crp/Fnr family transcriptional regulator [Pseudonocardia sp.]